MWPVETVFWFLSHYTHHDKEQGKMKKRPAAETTSSQQGTTRTAGAEAATKATFQETNSSDNQLCKGSRSEMITTQAQCGHFL
jgi:hypothetical protein